MSIARLVAIAVILVCADAAYAQRWRPLASAEDGFQMMVPGEMQVETIQYESEYGIGSMDSKSDWCKSHN